MILGLGRFPGEGHGNPLQYSCPENPMDRGAWWATILRVAKTSDLACMHARAIRKLMTNLDSILKSRDITFLTKVHIVKDMVFPVVMYGCESWTMKKAECRRIDAFELRGWRRLLRVHWTARRLNQLILKEINPEYSLEGLVLKVNLQ